jgi:hypothetical protein
MRTNKNPAIGLDEMILSKVRNGLKAGLGEPVAVLSLLLAFLGVWILLPAILLGGTSMSADKAAQLSRSQTGALRAVTASRIGLIRGDLWADAADIFDSVLGASADGTDNATSRSAKEHLSNACRNALSLAPISSRLWALCAPYCSDRETSDCVTRYIQMAYFTGPYRLESIPDRLRTAMTIDFARSPDTRMLVDEDIRFILGQEPYLKPALISSYSNALAINKPTILTQIKEIDPSFAATLR